MTTKVKEIIFRNKNYGEYDIQAGLECGHSQWFWGLKKDISVGDEVSCFKCFKEDSNTLNILK